MSTISLLMKTEMVTAKTDETVRDVAERMCANGVGAVIVLDGERLAGLFSERDLLTRVVAEAKDPSKTPVISVATRKVVTVDVSTRVQHCAEMIRDYGFRHLPVVSGARPVGILSTRDFSNYVIANLERFIDQAQYRQELHQGTDPYDRLGGSYGR